MSSDSWTISTRRGSSPRLSSDAPSNEVSRRASTRALSTSSAALRSTSSKTDSRSSHRARRPGSLGGHQVAEELPDERQPILADRLQGRLGVLGEGAGDAADPLVGLAGEQPALAVALLPQPAAAKASSGSAPRSRPPRHHLVDQLVVSKPKPRRRRLDQGAPQVVGDRRAEQRQVAEDRSERRVGVALEEEVVAQREHDVDAGRVHQPPQQLGEALRTPAG